MMIAKILWVDVISEKVMLGEEHEWGTPFFLLLVGWGRPGKLNWQGNHICYWKQPSSRTSCTAPTYIHITVSMNYMLTGTSNDLSKTTWRHILFIRGDLGYSWPKQCLMVGWIDKLYKRRTESHTQENKSVWKRKENNQ